MTGSHEHEYENQTCKKCKKHQKIEVMQCGPERHSSFHDNLTELKLARPKPKVAKPEVRHRLECRGKPRHEPPDMEFEEDSANNYLDKRVPASEPPKPTPAKCGVDIKLSNFKSKAIYCEVKLADLLSKAGPRVRPLAPGKYPDAPDSFRTSACCLLLGEISDILTPYSRVLRTILQHLEQAIYSNYVTPHTGGTFDQVPYFELIRKLEAQHERMLQNEERWKDMVKQQKRATDDIQEHIEDLNDFLVKEREKVAVLQHDLVTSQKILRKTTAKANDLEKKVEQSRALVLDASTVKQQYDEVSEKHDNVHARYIDLTKEVQRLHSNLAVARSEAADGVPRLAFNDLQEELGKTQGLLQKAQRFEHMAETFTPRPNWLQIRGGPFVGFPTAQQAAEIVDENKALTKRNLDLEQENATLAVALAEASQPKAKPDKKKGKGKKK